MDNKTKSGMGSVEENNDIVSAAKKKKKEIIVILCVIAVVAAIFFVGRYFGAKAEAKADEAVALADYQALIEGNDSLALEKYKEAAALGHKSGRRASLQVATALYAKGEYQQAIDYLKKGKSNSSVLEAGRLTLMGDCYVNLDDLNKAMDCYQSAAKAAKENKQIVPFILVKEANIYRAQKKYDMEAIAYRRILSNYPVYVNSHKNVDFVKLAERAEAQAQAQK